MLTTSARKVLTLLLSGFLTLLLSEAALAASVKSCKKLKESEMVDDTRDKSKTKKVYCSVAPRLGTVGDFVEIKNQYNYIVAVGRVVKQGKVGTIVVLTKYNRDEGSMAGYPAMLRVNENQDYWTASSAPF
ncbi:MAG: hypothetical protein EOP10_04960 [Proteobacteria bacterium]|nr:MAG: hypothetical protein EOP10_04960 [Pseudomonadota bacterium]